ncbi:hypothetical protein FRAHR75_450028 [Frankia sp. Hr75.2]|nr:hypothetical protein FRAHR75_450028 [Frankia sp. Hr75.2]SQD98729.1 hypothetical protein FMEAI12_4870022 [Parafrankia sp. Ea1.12]
MMCPLRIPLMDDRRRGVAADGQLTRSDDRGLAGRVHDPTG